MTTRVTPWGLTAKVLVDGLLPRIDSRLEASRRPFDRDDLFRPHARSRRWGWTHYGVFIPDLPAPYRYLNTMTFIGTTGTLMFDNDELAAADARNTATVLSSTAYADQHHYRAYDTSTECDFAEDGHLLKWGDDLSIRVALPNVAVDASYESFEAHITLTVTDTASYFVRSAIYDHVSLLAPYDATITDETGGHRFSGLGTFEYARCVSPQVLSSRPLPKALKLPADFFTYQVINLDADTQLLLTDVRAAGATACRLAHVRTRSGQAEVYSDVTFDVLEHGEALVDPWGNEMRRPSRMRWTVRDGDHEVLQIDGVLDAPWRFGHGRGYVSAYSYTGMWNGSEVSGNGYIEWVDCEP